jgi:FkbM family methyltransferase
MEGDGLRQPPGSKVSTAQLLREVEEYFAAGAAVSAGDTVVDVGANVGAFSLLVAKRCAGDVRLICFEPSPTTFQALSANFEENADLKRTRHTLHPLGLTCPEKSGQELCFANFRRFPTNSTFDIEGKRREIEIFFENRASRVRGRVERMFPGPLGNGVCRPIERVISSIPKGALGWWVGSRILGLDKLKAKLDTLDAVLRRERVTRVDLLKIDVEGSELEVLQGLGPETWRAVRQIVLETHNRDGRQTTIEALLKNNGLTSLRSVPQTVNDNGLKSVLLLGRNASQLSAVAQTAQAR